jgi:hypothetical protein
LIIDDLWFLVRKTADAVLEVEWFAGWLSLLVYLPEAVVGLTSGSGRPCAATSL